MNTPPKPAAERYFYFIATALLLVLTVIGFQLFYFHGQAYPGRPLTPPIKNLVITHGLAMSLWMLLALVQPFLVASGNRRLHMMVGRGAAVIAVGLVVLGFRLGVASASVTVLIRASGSVTLRANIINRSGPHSDNNRHPGQSRHDRQNIAEP